MDFARVFNRPRLFTAAGLVAALALSGCALTGVGGGRMPSSDNVEGHFATFGLSYAITNYDGSGAGSGRLAGSYADPYASGYQYGGQGGPVRMRFDGLGFGFGPCADQSGLPGAICPGEDPDDICIYGDGYYISTEKSTKGQGGEVEVTACDNDASGSPGPGDYLAIDVLSGPFEDYYNEGTITSGNIKTR